MNNWWKWVAAAAFGAAVMVAGCGGGGGGTPPPPSDETGNTAITYPFAGRFVELMNGTKRLDPLNLRVGDSGKLVLASFSADGSRAVLPATWSLAGGDGVTLNTSTGDFTVTAQPSGFFTIRSFPTSGTEVDQDAFVPTATTTVRGTVNADSTGYGVRFAQVEFFSSLGARIGASRTDGNGRFSALVDNAVSVTIKPETLPVAAAGTYSGFYRMIRYNGKYYTAGGSSCLISVGPFSVGSNVSLPYPLRAALQSSGPPPFPDGCHF